MSALTLGGEDVDSAEEALKVGRLDHVEKSTLNGCITQIHHVTAFLSPQKRFCEVS